MPTLHDKTHKLKLEIERLGFDTAKKSEAKLQAKAHTLKLGFDGLEFDQPKEGGVHAAGIAGGIYKDKNGKRSMVKCESDFRKNISEFLRSQFFQVLSPGSGAKVSLIAPQPMSKKLYHEGGKIQDNGSNIYVKSDFFDHYSNDMYKDMDAYMSAKTRPSDFARKLEGSKAKGRPAFMGTREWWSKTLTNAFKERNYQGFEQIAPVSLLINDFDFHTGNIGVIEDPKETDPRLVRIDFAESFNNLEEAIHPHSRSKHLPLWGPTNHYLEFPNYLKNNDLFADSVLKTAKIDLSSAIPPMFQELARYYTQEALAQWAQKVMPSKFGKVPITQITIQDIQTRFTEIMQKSRSLWKNTECKLN
ncbi:hypothetical protein [Candidatus Tisiphia endosymbiont of Nemotelus uliginosus]|uniref:hypothetical protein n=1 Tax=Candidatus Tisiphia endosymbiont of Nemotelus uliginosus TaxID=3077926 RepID=UPI0035C883E1